MTLTPSPWLFLRTVLAGVLAAIVIAYLWQGYRDGHWWLPDYILSLSIPAMIIPGLVWLAFVPSELAVSDKFLHIRFTFRQRHRINWSELRLWGNGGQSTFLLRVAGRRTFQIALFAFPRSQRRQFLNFLENRLPQLRARGWLGTWGFR